MLIFLLICVEVVGSCVKIDKTWFVVVLRVEAFSMEVEDGSFIRGLCWEKY